MLEGKAGMAAALSVMGSSAVSLPALAGLPHSGPSLQRLSEAGEGSDFGSSVPAPGGVSGFVVIAYSHGWPSTWPCWLDCGALMCSWFPQTKCIQ
jgi:hypothetical protein